MRPTILISLKCAGSHQRNSISPFSEIHESRVTNSNFWCFVFQLVYLEMSQQDMQLHQYTLVGNVVGSWLPSVGLQSLYERLHET